MLLSAPAAAGFLALFEDPETDLHVPALCDLEVASALRRLRRAGLLSEARQEEALTDYVGLPLTRHGHLALIPRVLGLADNFSAYDGAYVGLAEGLAGELATADERLGRAVEAYTAVSLA